MPRGRAARPRDAALALLLGARSARHVSGAARRPPALPREVGPGPAGGRPLLVRRSARRQAGRGRARARRVAARRAARAGVRAGRAAGVRLPARARRARAGARRVAARRRRRAEMPLFPRDRRRSRSPPPTTRWRRSTSSRAPSWTTARSAIWTRRPRRTAGPRCSIRTSCPRIVNLANIHYERDELVEAEALYEKADPPRRRVLRGVLQPRQHPSRPGALSRGGRARIATRWRSIPAYPEAHFYLAVTLEKLGRSVEAKPHWQQYRELAPDGEFVELAKEFSD